MRGRYLIRSRKSAALIAFADALLRLIPRSAAPGGPPHERILVASWGHVGDVLLTLPAIAALRGAFPDARIGMITGSWGRSAALGSKLVDDVHVIDHWALNRRSESKLNKVCRFFRTRARARAEIKRAGYQAGIDFYPFFPPAHPIFFGTGIPIRVGFDSGGFGSLLTHPHPWRDSDRSIAAHYGDLLDALLTGSVADNHSSWSYPREVLPGALRGLMPANYIAVHPGAGTPFKDWGEENWRSLIIALRASGSPIVITGSGAEESALAQRLAGSATGITNLAGRTDWEDFARVIANADAVICPDTVTAHLAALFHIPTVVIFTGTNNPKQWAPVNPHARILVKAVACAPCHRPGCPAMACIRGVSVSDVLDALQSLRGSATACTTYNRQLCPTAG
jgi:ADP-heptose:LPS heptosyltransferase